MEDKKNIQEDKVQIQRGRGEELRASQVELETEVIRLRALLQVGEATSSALDTQLEVLAIENREVEALISQDDALLRQLRKEVVESRNRRDYFAERQAIDDLTKKIEIDNSEKIRIIQALSK